jgi:hypothetical protein
MLSPRNLSSLGYFVIQTSETWEIALCIKGLSSLRYLLCFLTFKFSVIHMEKVVGIKFNIEDFSVINIYNRKVK